MAVDYAAFQSGQNPLQMAMQGFSDAGAIQQAQQQQQIGAQTLELNQMKIAEYQKAQAKQQEFQSALAKLGPKPSPQALQKLMMAYPQLGESLKSNFDILNPEQKQNKLMQATQISSALAAGGVPAALELVETQRVAAENSGDSCRCRRARGTEAADRDEPRRGTDHCRYVPKRQHGSRAVRVIL
jgi:preprotein translocase subunit SecD